MTGMGEPLSSYMGAGDRSLELPPVSQMSVCNRLNRILIVLNIGELVVL